MNNLTFETFGTSINNMFLQMDKVQQDLKDMRTKMEEDFAKAFSNMEKEFKELEGDKSSVSSVTRVSSNDGNTQAYKAVTVNGTTVYKKGVHLSSGRIMWMNCPDGEIPAAKEYLKSLEAPVVKAPSLAKFDNPSFTERVNRLLEGKSFFNTEPDERDAVAEEDPANEPTEDELNELEDEAEEEMSPSGADALEDAPKSGRFVLDPETGKFVFRR